MQQEWKSWLNVESYSVELEDHLATEVEISEVAFIHCKDHKHQTSAMCAVRECI